MMDIEVEPLEPVQTENAFSTVGGFLMTQKLYTFASCTIVYCLKKAIVSMEGNRVLVGSFNFVSTRNPSHWSHRYFSPLMFKKRLSSNILTLRIQRFQCVSQPGA